MSIVTFSVAEDFSGNLKPGQFHTEIEANTSITTEFIGLTIHEGNVNVQFTGNITPNEGNILTQLVGVHIPDFTPNRSRSIPLNPIITSFDNTEWVRLGLVQYSGSSLKGDINYIDVLSNMESAAVDYTIRVIDRKNPDPSNKLCEQTLTNTTLDFMSLGTISNIPTTETTLEVLGKTNTGNGKVEILKINLWYGN